MLWPLLLCAAASLLVIVRLLHSYGDRKRCAWYVQVASVASWYLPFTIVFILPFDFSSTLYRTCDHDCDEPAGYIGARFTRDLWAVLYWTMYLLTWLVLPLMMSYVDSGAFAAKDRLRDAAWSNLQFYGVGGAVGLVVVGYVALTRGVFGADLVAFMMALANFWGLFLVITFMGFGLVAIPRKLWRRGDLARELASIEARALAYKDRAYDSELELAETVAEAQLVAMRVNRADDLRPCIDRIMARCAGAVPPSRQPQSIATAARVPADISAPYLAALHNRIKHAMLREERDRWRWTRSARRAFFLQDVLQSRANPRRQLGSTLAPWSRWGMARRSAAWWWYVALRPFACRALAVVAGVLSIVILWSELTFNLASAHASAVRVLLRALGLSYLAVECASIVIIAYMCLCAYSSVMTLRIFNIYSLETHHHTSERSLLFCGAYLCRLMFPLCYNFLSMAGSGFADGTAEEVTEFAAFMDKIDLVPVLGEQSNRAIPVLIMVPAALALFNVHGRVMEYFSIDRVSSAAAQSADSADEELGPLCLPHEEGRRLLADARLAAEREQGIADRPSPAASARSSSANLRAHAASISGDAPASRRASRDWYSARPSLDDDAAAGLLLDDAAALPAPSDHMPLFQSRRPFGNYSSHPDLAAIVDSAGTDPYSDAGDPSDAAATGPKPTGMAARFGRLLPARQGGSQLSKSRPKFSSAARPGNVTRLRPSSRQSSRSNYNSDDGQHLLSPRAANAAHQPLLLSPSSPGRMPNPWADGADSRAQQQSRRHALSDSSAYTPKS
ncbi:hypothetical protein EV175_004527 [Coemansia sp. RSA 1933]|nr:hypothetical protein EV175_004527 [Coemansia sp. RSA 1933]